MSTEDNKALVRRFYEEFCNKGDLKVADEIVLTDYAEHENVLGATSGRDGLKQFVTTTLAAFPDFHFTIEDAIAEGNKVAVRLTARGTHRGPLGDIPPTGNQVANTAIVIFRITDGKIVERWGVADQLLLLQQLGVIPPMGQAS